MRYVAVSVVTDRQTDRQTHRTITVTLTHAPRVNERLKTRVYGTIVKLMGNSLCSMEQLIHNGHIEA